MSIDPYAVRPVIVVDTREQTPLEFGRYPTCRAKLATGDYSIKGFESEFVVERKTIDDLVGCTGKGRGRFERELGRLRGVTFSRIVVVGRQSDITDHNYHSTREPKSIWHTLGAWEARYAVPVLFRATAKDAAQLIEWWAMWFAREALKRAGEVQVCEEQKGVVL